MNENKNKPSVRKAFGTDAFKLGGSQAALVAAVIIIAVLINLIVGKLPAKATKFDLSAAGFFTLSQQSKKIASELDEKVTLYLVAETGDEDKKVASLLDKYKDESDNIEVEYVDPVLYPTFTQKYTEETLSANSVIVEGSRRAKAVDYSKILVVDYSNYYTTGQTTTSFDGEGAITSAIAYVSSDDLPIVYTLQGHGEASLSETMSNMLDKDNYTLQPLNLLTGDGVPDDCDALMIVSPRADISEREVELLSDYLDNGGSVMLFSDVGVDETPNLDALLDTYGLRIEKGIIYERDSGHYYTGTYYQYLLPEMASHDITASMLQGGQYVLAPIAQGITTTDDHRSTLDISHFLTTTSDSYLKHVDHEITTAEKEAGDVDGPFSVGTAVTEETTNGTSHLVVFSTSALLDEGIDSLVYSGNSNLVLNALGWMCEHEQSMAIHAKPVDAEILVIPASAYNTLSIAIVIVLPLAVVAIGAAVTLSRRKK